MSGLTGRRWADLTPVEREALPEGTTLHNVPGGSKLRPPNPPERWKKLDDRRWMQVLAHGLRPVHTDAWLTRWRSDLLIGSIPNSGAPVTQDKPAMSTLGHTFSEREDKLNFLPCSCGENYYTSPRSALCPVRVAAAIDAAEARGIERAAKVAEDYDGDGLNSSSGLRAYTAQLGDAAQTQNDIVRAIRALVPEER